MKKIKIISGIVLLAILALVIVNYNLLSTAEQDVLPETIVVEKDITRGLGTKENPLVILEIVPHESHAEIGYTISGCEPINMQEIIKRSDLNGTYESYAVSSGLVTKGDNIQKYCFPDEITSEHEIDKVDTRLYSGSQVADVADGKLMMSEEDANITTRTKTDMGVWNLNKGTRTMSGYYQRVADGTGHFNLVDSAFEFVGIGEGNYIWVTAENIAGIATDYYADQIWTERTCGGYYSYQVFNYTHNNDLIEFLFPDEEPSQVNVQVITVAPHQFLNEENLKLIEQADLIYAHKLSGGDVKMWTELNVAGENGTVKELVDKDGNSITQDQAKSITFAENDMPWPAVMAVMKRMCSDNPAGLILTSDSYVNVNSNNFHKLWIMVRQYGPTLFEELFIDTGMIKESDVQDDGLTTGIYVKNNTDIIDWAEDTFRPDITLSSDWRNDLIHYGMKNPTFTSEEEWNMIQDNVFCYKGGNDFLMTFLQERGQETSQNGEAYDYYEELYGTRPTGGLTGPETIKFLLQDFTKKRQLKILEVQPCNEFIYGSDGWEVYYLSMFTWFTGDLEEDLEVVTMPTWQFISSIEDLNSEYDAIIFGSNQNASNGKTFLGNQWVQNYDYVEYIDGVGYYYNFYQDDNLNVKNSWGGLAGSLAYTSVGDIVTTTSRDTTMRYSGTDITAKKLEELKSYLNAGKPIIFDRSLIDRTTSPMTPNAQLIDTSSNMYQLVAMYGQEVEDVATDNLFVRSMFQANKLKRVLAYETCKIQFDESDDSTGYPTEYDYTPAEDGTLTEVVYSPTRTFEYKFKIVGKSGQKYGINLFIDMNGDGIYDGSMKEADYEEVLASASSELVSGIIVKDNLGNVVKANELYANVNYTLSKTLENNYQGILPWKLEAYKVDNPNCRNNVVKYSALKTSSGNKEKIKVLLMNLTPYMAEPSDFYSSNSAINYVIRKGFIRMNNMEQFQRYLSCVDEYDVQLEFLTNTEWMKMFDPESKGFDSSALTDMESNIIKWKQYLDGYDMLILGFNDDCTYTNSYIYNEGFTYFVEQGKSVILSHDMVRSQDQNKLLLTNFDEQLRQMTGQRRFFTDKVQINGNDVSLFGSHTSNYQMDLGNGIIAPGTMDNATRQFISFGNLDQADRAAFTRGKWGAEDGADGSTEYINIINQGQITNYPYKIPDVIKIANTHTQNYQLNLEDGDVVVWYGLTDKYSETYQEEILAYGAIPEDQYEDYLTKVGKGVYSSIENDGRNSFYIYNKGNITYTGLGHDGRMTDEEVQLFVNTMISAYRATAAIPKIEITNEDAIISENSATLYAPLDDVNFGSQNQYLDVRFKVSDNSITSVPRTYELQYKDKDGKIIDVDTLPTYFWNSKAPVSADSTNNIVGVQKADDVGEYYFWVPYSKIREEGVVEYQLVLRATVPGGVPTESVTTVTVMPMPLFVLD